MNAPTHFATPTHWHVSQRDFFLPLAIIGGLTLLLATLGTHFAVRAFDRASAAREQILARNGIAQRIDEVAQIVLPQMDWDDAVAHLDNRYDAGWAEANIGKYLAQTDGIDGSFILDRDDRLIFASRGGLETTGTSFAPVARQAAPLLASVRTREAARGALRPLASGAMVSRPIQASALDMVDGKLSILTATLVQPDFGKALPLAARAPIVVTAIHIDQAFLDIFARRYMLDGLHLRAADQPRKSGEVEIPALDQHGRTIGWFAWSPLDPGYTMLRNFLPPVALIFLLLAGVAAWQLRKVQVAARELLEREAEYRRIAADLVIASNRPIPSHPVPRRAGPA